MSDVEMGGINFGRIPFMLFDNSPHPFGMGLTEGPPELHHLVHTNHSPNYRGKHPVKEQHGYYVMGLHRKAYRPKKLYSSRKHAKADARALAVLNPGKRFVVLLASDTYVCNNE